MCQLWDLPVLFPVVSLVPGTVSENSRYSRNLLSKCVIDHPLTIALGEPINSSPPPPFRWGANRLKR